MISILEGADTADFFQRDGIIVLYGAGNSGYWIGYYMKKCKQDFVCYLDKALGHEGALCNEKPIYKPGKLAEFQNQPIRIVITPHCYESVLYDLLEMDRYLKLNISCLIPKYRFAVKGEVYSVNKFLGYFRRQLLQGDIPTIVSNDCTAGHIYEILDSAFCSPTINVTINPEDFLKLCYKPFFYLKQDIESLFWERRKYFVEECPAGKLGDITVDFAHDVNMEGIIERWNRRRQRINWNRLIYILSDSVGGVIPFRILKQFDKLENEHFLLIRRSGSFQWMGECYNLCYFRENYFGRHDSAIENYFDFLGWINREYE